MAKYVILHHFYVFLLQKYKIKKDLEEHFLLLLWNFKPQVGNLNFDQTSSG